MSDHGLKMDTTRIMEEEEFVDDDKDIDLLNHLLSTQNFKVPSLPSKSSSLQTPSQSNGLPLSSKLASTDSNQNAYSKLQDRFDPNDLDDERTLDNIFDYGNNDDDDDNSDNDYDDPLKKDKKKELNTNGIFSVEETYTGSTLFYQQNGDTKVKPEVLQNEFNSMIEELRTHKLSDGGKIKMPGIWSGPIDRLPLRMLLKEFYSAYEMWCGKEAKKIHPIVLPYAIFGIDMKEYVIEEVIDQIKETLIGQLTSFDIVLKRTGLLTTQGSETMQKSSELQREMDNVRKKLNKMYEVLYHSHRQLMASARLRNVVDEQNENAIPSKYDLFNFQALNYNDMSGTDKLILFMQRTCAENKLRKKGKTLYRQRYTKSKSNKVYATHYYEPFTKIENYILQQCNARTNLEMWKYLNDGTNLKKVAERLEQSQDEQLPDLKQDRTVSAWKNGLYFAEYNAFLPYGNVDIPPEVCASVYIDQKFDSTNYGDNFMKIPCVIKQILSDQGYDEHEQSFILGQLGRLVFKPGKYDRWEVIPFLWGMAGTGKSCIIEACMRYFDRQDVAGVGNSIEKQFGLYPLIGKNLWVAMDVKHNFGMDAGDLQTITSLEAMSVAVKYEGALTVDWDVPGIIAGNELPRSWKDTLESLARRIMLIAFPNPIQRDNSVKERLKNEHSAFYKITVSAYHWWARRYGDKNIWPHAPKKFLENQKHIQRNENPLEEFLEHGNVVFTGNEEHSVPISLVNTWFRNWCSAWGHRNTLIQDELVKAMAKRGIKCRMESKQWHPLMSQMSNESSNISANNNSNGNNLTQNGGGIIPKKTLYQEKKDQSILLEAEKEKEREKQSSSSTNQSIQSNQSNQPKTFNNNNNSSNNNYNNYNKDEFSPQLSLRNERFFIGILMNSKSSARHAPYKNTNGLYADASKNQHQQRNFSQHINLKK